MALNEFEGPGRRAGGPGGMPDRWHWLGRYVRRIGRHGPRLLKATLAVMTVVLLLSQVGFLLVPVLLPLHVWAGRRSGTFGRIGWSMLPAAGLGASAWAVVYVAVGEAKPAIWLVPAVVLAASWALLLRWTTTA
jgi:hypothetical protein